MPQSGEKGSHFCSESNALIVTNPSPQLHEAVKALKIGLAGGQKVSMISFNRSPRRSGILPE
jgi:hypothetical protein